MGFEYHLWLILGMVCGVGWGCKYDWQWFSVGFVGFNRVVVANLFSP